ncbi:hypothetical protein H5410_051587 [Solanum commersonii]|uniref:Uncharacterized protein n=1 Tax=Solanum commersonii TaxID=4109 RepID=A0A9J5X1G1_SOLCO|nr:hypothetical protein H5410_051587 [Solanum commersonii]
MKTSLHLTPLTLSSRVLGYRTRAHPLQLNLVSTHSLGHQSSGFGFATFLLGKPKTHGWLFFTYCVAENCSATLVEIADELDDPPFGQLIAISVLPLASSHSGSLGGFTYWNEGRFMSFWRLAKLNSAIRRIPFLVLFSPICSVLCLSVHVSTKIQILETSAF